MTPKLLAFLTLAFIPALRAADPQFDLVIGNGHIIDGTGSPWYSGDVGIANGRIVQIGNLSKASARRFIDVEGQVVAPGFIDMLGQSQLSILVNPHLPSKVFQGITTEITGEGGSVAPLNKKLIAADHPNFAHYRITPDWLTFREYFAHLEKQSMEINLASYVGCSFLFAAQSPGSLGPPIIVEGLPASPLGQVPESVARIVGVDTSVLASGRDEVDLKVQNTGTKPIRVYFVRLIDVTGCSSIRGTLQMLSSSGSFLPGSVQTVPFSRCVTDARWAQQVEIAAVIFADGTHIGSAPNPSSSTDLMSDLFDQWKGEAEAAEYWQKKVASMPVDDRARVAAFIEQVGSHAGSPMGSGSSWYAAGADAVNARMAAMAKELREQVSLGHKSYASARLVIDSALKASSERARARAVDGGVAKMGVRE